jgi:translation initiation factor 2-alpha kinase 4
MDGTGQVGTYFYTAPEIEQGWPKIDEKVNFWWQLLQLNLQH